MRGIFLDLETSGLDPWQHRTLEAAFRLIDLSSMEELASYHQVVSQPPDVWEKRDPESIQVNGFTWEEVATGKSEADVRQDILQIFKQHQIERGNAIFICQNPSFDRAFMAQLIDTYQQERLRWPYHWLDFASMYWSLTVERSLESGLGHPSQIPLSKDAIAEACGLPKEEKPHRAMNGVDHLILLYKAVVAGQQAAM